MTPPEKAKQLYETHLKLIYDTLSETGDGTEARELAIKAAKVTCEEIIFSAGTGIYWVYVMDELDRV